MSASMTGSISALEALDWRQPKILFGVEYRQYQLRRSRPPDQERNAVDQQDERFK